MFLLDFKLSVASAVGFIVLAGVAVEIGALMIMYLKQEVAAANAMAREEGAQRRLRPIMMTFAVIFAGLLPIMYGHGAGGEVMRCIATPMIGGIVSATMLALVVIPAVYFLWNRRALTATSEIRSIRSGHAPAE